jgi:hypothetical protein
MEEGKECFYKAILYKLPRNTKIDNIPYDYDLLTENKVIHINSVNIKDIRLSETEIKVKYYCIDCIYYNVCLTKRDNYDYPCSRFVKESLTQRKFKLN